MNVTNRTYKMHHKECNGICVYCKEMAWGAAEPTAESVYCSICENRGVVGIQKAVQLGLVSILKEEL